MPKAILLAGFGSGGQQGQRALLPFDAAVRQAFPDLTIRWAFTSDLMRRRLTSARKKTDSVHKALCRLGFEKYASVAIQPLQVIRGREHENLLDEIAEAKKNGAPRNIALGAPLLDYERDRRSVERAALAVLRHIPPERRPEDALVCAGHGSSHEGGLNYARLGEALKRHDEMIFVGTLSGADGFASLLAELERGGAGRVWLMPMLSVQGKHALEDITGRGDSSWRGMLEKTGRECLPIARGLVEYEAFIELWLDNLRAALAEL